MILDLISQSVLEEALGNSADSMPNKIKEKEESLQNTLNKRYSIPVMAIQKEKTFEERDNERNSVIAEYDAPDNEPSVEAYTTVQQSTQKYDNHIESDGGYTIASTDVRSLIEGNERPINVKNHMVVNMMQKDINDFSDYQGQHVNNVKEEELNYDEHIVSEPVREKVKFDELDRVLEQAKPKTEIGKYGIPVNIEKALSSTFDFDNTMVAIHQSREEYKNVSEKANIAAQAANESEELLQKVSSEYTEAEKQLREKEKRSMEMERKIISILNSQKDRINEQMHKKESIINDANKRKEQNDDKIVDFRSKISSAKEKENEIDEKLSRQEELLNTLVGFNINLDDYSLDDDRKNSGKVV